jgi:hopene-associated glycosyltransferase HpnB
MIGEVIGGAAVAVWTYLLFARGGFWRVSAKAFLSDATATHARVAVVIPARNEAEFIGRTVTSILQQDHPGPLHILVVDDHSADHTSAAAIEAADAAGKRDSLSVIASAPLPGGWTGKLWAVHQGVVRSAELRPEYIWLTDADVVHGPATLRNLIGKAREGFDLVSLMVKLRCESLAERAFLPAFVFFFFKLYPPAWIADHKRKSAGAAGGCMLVKIEALDSIGGIASIRGELIDDCALARKIKGKGGVWLGLSNESTSLRSYPTWRDVANMISRTAFTQLKHSTVLLFGTLLGLIMTYLAAPVLLFTGGWAAFLGLIAWTLMTVAYLPMVRFYRQPVISALSLPLVAAFYATATAYSAVQYWTGKGGEWKGRVQDPVRG